MPKLAYVFWHWPRADSEVDAYEAGLLGFHSRLAGIPGLVASVTFRVEGLPWQSEARYEDWYVIDGFDALGVLNTSAVSGSHQDPHEQLAAAAAGGAGGLMKLAQGDISFESGVVRWLTKPSGMTYGALTECLNGSVWQRQLVLGPQPEFCVSGDVDLADGVHTCVRQVLSVDRSRTA